jgi:pseudaminic acid synthase
MDKIKSVFIIAELSANHGGKIEIAIESIKAIKRTGADAVKLQTYTPDTITLDSDNDDFLIKGGTIWDNQKLHDLYQEASLPWEWHEELFRVAKEEGLICFSSPFDSTAVDLLESLDCPIYKIASLEITDIPLIEYVAKKGKPIILSTGIANFDDIDLAINTIRKNGVTDITVLKCTTAYPTPIEESNLIMMKQMEKDFDVKVGLSDHTLGIVTPVVSVALGATMIEKHFILDKNIGGPDASFSLDEKEFTEMVRSVRDAEKSIGIIDYNLTEKQKIGKTFARSLYVVEDIAKGEKISTINVKSIRPGYGLHPKHFKEVLGKTANIDLKKGDRLTFDIIS